MEVRIGVQNVAREIVLETEMTADAVAKAVGNLEPGTTLDLVDDKGRRVIVPAASVGYVEIGEETKHRVGFNTGL